jgi:uncharacterized protein YggU (UPF0235/DUF167 family)
MAFWRPAEAGVRVAVKVQPKSRRPGLHGTARVADGSAGDRGMPARLCIAVAEPAADGQANRAACATLARALDVAAGSVSVIAGATSREKTLHVAGDPEMLAARLAGL